MERMKVILISEIDALQQVEASYHALLEKVGGIERLYYSLDYIRISVGTFEALGAQLFFIVVLEDGEVMAVLPFQRVATRAFGLKSTIRFWGECNIYAHNVHQKILADGYQPDALDAAILFLQTDVRHMWDTIEFARTRMEDENLIYFASQFPGSRTSLTRQHYYYFNTCMDLDGHLGPKQLKNIRRRRRRLEEDFGPIVFTAKERVSEDDLEEIKILHTARQRQVEEFRNAFFTHPLESKYVEELFHLWNELKCVHYYSLRVREKLIAMRVMIHMSGVTYAFVMAFDSQFKKYAPARILAYESFRNEIEHYGVAKIETSWGVNQLKKDYASGRYELHDVEILSPRFKSKIIHFVINRVIELRQTSRALSSLVTSLGRTTGK